MHGIAIELKFCYAHRLLKHNGKCRHIHGHNGRALIEIMAADLDENEMVVDFSEVKEVMKAFVDKFWDHNLILNCEDPMMQVMDIIGGLSPVPDIFMGKQPFCMKVGDPTAENMAKCLFDKAVIAVGALTGKEAYVNRVEVFETDTCSASYQLQGEDDEPATA